MKSPMLRPRRTTAAFWTPAPLRAVFLLLAVLPLTVCSRLNRGGTEAGSAVRESAQESQQAQQSAVPGAVDTVQKKYALIIGNGAYTGITRLNNPVNDAADMKAALESLGFTVDVVVNGGQEQMESAATRLRGRLSAERNSYGFFFYAGHAVQSGGENYLIPVDANIQSENFLRQKAVSVQAVLGELNDAGNALNIVVLDACRDNPFSWSRSGSRGLQVVSDQPADSIIVYATGAGNTAADGEGRNGLFTTHLLANLKTPGLSVRDLFDKTGADVRRASGGKQIPAIYSQFFETAWLGGRPAVAVQPSPQPAPQPNPTPVQPVAPPVRPVPDVDVYLAGSEDKAAGNSVAWYWKNGVKTALSDGSTRASAYAIAVLGNDVYVAGMEYNVGKEPNLKHLACYWKNGVRTVLFDGNPFGVVSDLIVSGNDVYIAGKSESEEVFYYWKNGVKTALSGGSASARAWAIAVSGNDVYLAGEEGNTVRNSVAWYWKNGVKTALSDGSTNARAYAIAVSGNDVYLAGEEWNAVRNSVAWYWKNGVKTALSDGSTRAEADSIAVSGNDVYIAGSEDNAAGNSVACYWKNGVKTTLSDGSTRVSAYAIAVLGNDVYVTGMEYNATDKMVACYWKNGVKTALSDGIGYISAIAVVPR
jgi:hypothetical protein